jgi:orotate phosphoribosyltransferase-like protein
MRASVTPEIVASSHMRPLLEEGEREAYISAALKVLEKYHDKYDTMAFQGMSGAVIAPILARKLGKQLLLVRKSSDDTHSRLHLEGNHSCKKYIIVDDFIDTGATVERIQKKVYSELPKATCIGVLEVERLKGKPPIDKENVKTALTTYFLLTKRELKRSN